MQTAKCSRPCAGISPSRAQVSRCAPVPPCREACISRAVINRNVAAAASAPQRLASAFSTVAVTVGLLAAPLNMAMAPSANATAIEPEVAVETHRDLERNGKLTTAKAYDDLRMTFGFMCTVAVETYRDLERNGKLTTAKAYDDLRMKFGFKRTADGRTMLKNDNGEWYNLRLDMEVPGAMLLRDTKGFVYAMQTDGLKQVDLTDDYIVMLMFSSGEWMEQKMPLTYMDAKGKEATLQMEENDFRNVRNSP
eukprot:gene688-2120_t